ncbi:sulfotransferase [Alphaproteobacteria bacterium]|nr:sulfotransferase [Alphaproteobacteria bacterium]
MSRDFWHDVNAHLEVAEVGTADSVGDAFETPPIIILAPPRGGSTLLQQVLISTGTYGYVSNIMARFWRAPLFGARLQNSLNEPDFVSSFVSKYGNTVGPLEPHEWGWFWQRWFDLRNDEHYISRTVEWHGLRRTLRAMEHIHGAPLIFDNGFLCANLDRIERGIGPILVLNLTRSPWHVCNSLVNARIERYQDINRFYGARPRRMDLIEAASDPVEKAVLQARLLQDETDAHLALFPSNQVLDISYEALRAEPMSAVESVTAFVARHGTRITGKPAVLRSFPDRNRAATVHRDYRRRLDTLVAASFTDAAIPDW